MKATSRTALNKQGEREAAKIAFPEHNKSIDFIAAVYTLQKHSWGAAHHFDLRIQKKTGNTWFGFTWFSEPWLASTTRHVMGEGKGYAQLIVPKQAHPTMESLGDNSWMDFHGEMQPGTVGNPTKNLVAKMELIEHRAPCVLHRRELDNVLITFCGVKMKGTFLLRLIESGGEVRWTLVRLSEDKQFNQAIMHKVAQHQLHIPMLESWSDPRIKELI